MLLNKEKYAIVDIAKLSVRSHGRQHFLTVSNVP